MMKVSITRSENTNLSGRIYMQEVVDRLHEEYG